MPIRHSSHARHELWYHVAWSAKDRKKVWNDEAKRENVKRLFRKIAYHYDMDIGAIEPCSDRIHFTLTAPPRMAPACAVRIS
jgi:REP element-mobilizing transposase RayT